MYYDFAPFTTKNITFFWQRNGDTLPFNPTISHISGSEVSLGKQRLSYVATCRFAAANGAKIPGGSTAWRHSGTGPLKADLSHVSSNYWPRGRDTTLHYSQVNSTPSKLRVAKQTSVPSQVDSMPYRCTAAHQVNQPRMCHLMSSSSCRLLFKNNNIRSVSDRLYQSTGAAWATKLNLTIT